VAAPALTTRNTVDAFMRPRDLEHEDNLPSDEEVELFERVREDSARARVRRRTLVIAGVALLMLVGALALALRGPRSPATVTAPTDEPAADRTVLAPEVARPIAPAPASETPRVPQIAAPAPREAQRGAQTTPSEPPEAAASLALPERAEQRDASARSRVAAQRSARVATSDAAEQRSAPAAMPSAAASRPPVRVEVTQTPGDGAVDYSVRVTNPDGTPVTNAAVRLRGVMSDGARVEARLDPAGEPGVYQSLLAVSARGPHLLTLRVASADGILEVPVADPPAGGGVRP
jgi:hypothetical protein